MFGTQKRLQNLEHLLEETKSELERTKAEVRLQDKMTLFTADLTTDLYDAAPSGSKKIYAVVEKRFQKLGGYVTGLFEYHSSYLSLKAATVPDGQKCIHELERISDYRKANFSVSIEDSPYLQNICSKPSITDVSFNKLLSQMVRSYLVAPITSRLNLKDARVTIFPLMHGPELNGFFTIAGNDDPDTIRPYMEIFISTLSYVLYGCDQKRTKTKRL